MKKSLIQPVKFRTVETRRFQRSILKSIVSHDFNFKSWFKPIYDKITYIFCVINEFNPTFEVQNMGDEAFQNASFLNALFPKGYSCLWAVSAQRQLQLPFGNGIFIETSVSMFLNFKSWIKLIYNAVGGHSKTTLTRGGR